MINFPVDSLVSWKGESEHWVKRGLDCLYVHDAIHYRRFLVNMDVLQYWDLNLVEGCLHQV